MRKICSLAFTFAILLCLLSIPAYALENDQMNRQTNVRNNDNSNNPINTSIPNDVTNNYRTNNFTNDQMNNHRSDGNTYRANAVNNNRNFNWGWLGLIGLAGLIGLRNRESERT